MQLFSNCCFPSSYNDKTFRQSHQSTPRHQINNDNDKFTSPHSKHSNYDTLAQTPLKIKLIDTLGLKNFLINNFIFARRQSTYKLQLTKNNSNKKKKFKFTSTSFKQIPNYQQICDIIQTQNNFIPVIHFKKKHTRTHQLAQQYYGSQLLTSFQLTLIFSHGNSSDLEYCYQLIQMMVRKYPVNYIIYDYTGYGNECSQQKKFFLQHKHQLSEQSICQDLRKVIIWSKVPYENIILWGFSLGCYPSLKMATQITVNNIILQSPFASIFHFIQSQQQKQQKIFKQDLFNNLQLVSRVNCDILLIHSQDDDMIPIKHSRMLLNRFNQSRNQHYMRLIQICNVKHNQTNLVLILEKKNQLQVQFQKYLVQAEINRERSKLKDNNNKNNKKTQNKFNKKNKRNLSSVQNSHDKQSQNNPDISISRIVLSQSCCQSSRIKNEHNPKQKDYILQQNRSTQQNQLHNNVIKLNQSQIMYQKLKQYSFQIEG